MVKQISKDMIITDHAEVDPDIAGILIQNSMGCELLLYLRSLSPSRKLALFMASIRTRSSSRSMNTFRISMRRKPIFDQGAPHKKYEKNYEKE